jgi:hypothetical protein
MFELERRHLSWQMELYPGNVHNFVWADSEYSDKAFETLLNLGYYENKQDS